MLFQTWRLHKRRNRNWEPTEYKTMRLGIQKRMKRKPQWKGRSLRHKSQETVPTWLLCIFISGWIPCGYLFLHSLFRNSAARMLRGNREGNVTACNHLFSLYCRWWRCHYSSSRFPFPGGVFRKNVDQPLCFLMLLFYCGWLFFLHRLDGFLLSVGWDYEKAVSSSSPTSSLFSKIIASGTCQWPFLHHFCTSLFSRTPNIGWKGIGFPMFGSW